VEASMSNTWFTAIIALLNLLLIGVGLYLANNLRRQLHLKVVDRKLESYMRLWALMKVAGPWRLECRLSPISAHERKDLYDSMTNWYFGDGNGMLLDRTTREMYLNAKFNLIGDDEELRPSQLIDGRPQNLQERERWRGELSMSQLSLLRQSMRYDLAIYTDPYQTGPLEKAEKQFLEAAGVDLKKKPWKPDSRDSQGRKSPRAFREEAGQPPAPG
jgi:hypothetical protein